MKEEIRAKRDSKVSSPRLGEKGEGGQQGPWEEGTAGEGWPGISRSGYKSDALTGYTLVLALLRIFPNCCKTPNSGFRNPKKNKEKYIPVYLHQSESAQGLGQIQINDKETTIRPQTSQQPQWKSEWYLQCPEIK